MGRCHQQLCVEHSSASLETSCLLRPLLLAFITSGLQQQQLLGSFVAIQAPHVRPRMTKCRHHQQEEKKIVDAFIVPLMLGIKQLVAYPVVALLMGRY